MTAAEINRAIKCPECKKNGIQVIEKILMLFRIPVRCRVCGALFSLRMGASFIVMLLINAFFLFAIFFSIHFFSVRLLWLLVATGLIFLCVLILYLPMKKVSALRHKIARN